MTSVCELCGKVQWKYKCPRCSMKTCSLECVKQHKTERDCDGLRDKTAYVRIRDMSDITLLSDYRMLEDVARLSDNHSRDPLQRKPYTNGYVHILKRAVQNRGLKVKFLPHPMSKRKENTTKLSQHKHGEILWHLKLVFPQAEAKYTEKGVNENLLLFDILKPFIHPSESDPVRRQLLKSYTKTSMESCKVFMKMEGLPANISRYHSLDQNKSLLNNLIGREFVEFPTLHVVLPSHVHLYPTSENGIIESSVSGRDEKDFNCINTEVLS